MNSFKELKNNIKCPCESGKNYGDCCKNKKLVFGFEGNKLIKKIPVSQDIKHLLKEVKDTFVEYYGREPKDNDFIAFSAPVYNNQLLLNMVYTLREIGISEDEIYAYYMSDGLLECGYFIRDTFRCIICIEKEKK